MADFALETSVENYTSKTVVRPNWGRAAGAGRTKGTPNKITAQQRHVAAMVLGDPGSLEFEEFVKSERKAALDQSMAPAVKTMWMHYLVGKPVDHVEVKDTTDDLELTAEQMRERAKVIAARVVEEPHDESSVH